MKDPTPRDLRNAVVITVIVTAIVMMALLDPSCRSRVGLPSQEGPSRSIHPP